MKPVLIILAIIALVIIVGWVGFQIKPRPYPSLGAQPALKYVSLPADLPAPVERFYRTIYGDQVPLIETAVITGRGTMQPVMAMPAFQARFTFQHQTGKNYRHFMELTWFGIPVAVGNEHYVDGVGVLDIQPIGVSSGEKVNQGANLALWAEAVLMPSVWVTDPQARWEAVDDHTAILVVPFEGQEERMIMRFDPASGLLTHLEAMRWRDDTDQEKKLWIDEAVDWVMEDGMAYPRIGKVTWFDQGKAWAVFEAEEVRYNVEIGDINRNGW